MGRPTNKVLLDTLIATVSEEWPISVKRLQPKFTWTEETFESILRLAIDVGMIRKGQGGGGGVVHLTDIATEEVDEVGEEEFMLVVQELVMRSPDKRAKSDDVQARLNLSSTMFRAVRAQARATNRIAVSTGPGAYIYLVDVEGTPTSLTQSSPAASKSEVHMQSNGVFREHDKLRADSLLRELQIDRDNRRERTNRGVRETLGWSPYEYWQTRTRLVDDGQIVAGHGDMGIITIPVDRPKVAVDPNVGLVLRSLIDAVRSNPDLGNTQVGELAASLGKSEEDVVVACSRLLAMQLIQVDGALVGLNPHLLENDSSDDGMFELLDAFGSEPLASTAALADVLIWDKPRVAEVIGKCLEHQPPLLDWATKDILKRLDAAKEFEKTRKGQPAGANICLSPEVFDELHRAVHNRRVTAFVGAGVSVPAGLPKWSKLLEPLLERLDYREKSKEREEIGILLKEGPAHAAEALHQALGKQFDKQIKEILEVYKYPGTGAIESLALLKGYLRGVVTTNLDRLLEDNLKWPAVTDLAGNAQGPISKVVHLHGMIDSPQTWVLTNSQYNKKYYGDQAYADHVKSLFLRDTLMFVGYGMRDYEIDRVCDRLESYDVHDRPNHYFFMQVEEARAQPYFMRRLENLGLQLIKYRDHDDLPVLLARLALPLAR